MPTAKEFAWFAKESALGTIMTSPVAGTDNMFVRLTDGNSLEMTAEPIIEEIPYGGGYAVTAEAVSDHYNCTGSLKTKLYPSQALFFLSWAITRINSGQTLPWVTTEVPGDLASASVYHAIKQSSGVYLRERYAGAKVETWAIDFSRQATTAMMTLGIKACRKYPMVSDSAAAPLIAEFPDPLESDMPTGPFTFKQTAGGFTVGSVRTQYDSLSIKGSNKLDGQFFETSYLTLNQFNGRDVTVDADLYFKATPADRTDFEAIAAKSASVVITNGVTTVTISLNAQNTIMGLKRNLPLAGAYMQALTLKNRFDPAAASGVGSDVSVTVA